jgi:ABC transporter substrate binding protein
VTARNFLGVAELAVIQAVASSREVEIRVVDARDISGIETAIAQFARQPNGGLIVTSSGPAIANRDRIIAAATSHRLPSVYANHFWADGGGLISYGSDINEQYRRAADYVDRIFKGEKPADLPVQSPTKYEFDHQSEHREVARHRCAANPARPHRQGNRMRRRARFLPLPACGEERNVTPPSISARAC